MSDDFIKVVVEPRPGMSADWQTYRPKPSTATVKARRMNHAFTIEGQTGSGQAGDYLVEVDGALTIMAPAQFAAAYSAVRGPRPAKATASAE